MLIITTMILLIIESVYSKIINNRFYFRILSICLLYCGFISFDTINLEYNIIITIFNGSFIINNSVIFIQSILYILSSIICHIWSPVINNNNYTTNTIKEHTLIVLFILFGSIILVGSNSLISMFLSLEIQSLSLYVISTIYRYSESSTYSGLKYLILGGFSSSIILLSTAILYSIIGTFSYIDIYTIIQYNNNILTNNNLYFGFSLLILGIIFKVSSAPLHNWAPDVYDGTPTIITIWLTVIPKISLFIAIYNVINIINNIWLISIIIGAFMSLIIGTILGITQYRIKRLFTYSTISHVGFLLIALSISSIESYSAFYFYLVQYSIANFTLFGLLLAIGYNQNNKDIELISNIVGIVYKNPILCINIAVILFSIAGIPPILGFFAKINVLYASISNNYIILSIIAIVSSVISAYYYLRLVSIIFFTSGPKNNSVYRSTVIISNIQSILLSVNIIIIIGYIFYPNILLNVCILLSLSNYTI